MQMYWDQVEKRQGLKGKANRSMAMDAEIII